MSLPRNAYLVRQFTCSSFLTIDNPAHFLFVTAACKKLYKTKTKKCSIRCLCYSALYCVAKSIVKNAKT